MSLRIRLDPSRAAYRRAFDAATVVDPCGDARKEAEEQQATNQEPGGLAQWLGS